MKGFWLVLYGLLILSVTYSEFEMFHFYLVHHLLGRYCHCETYFCLSNTTFTFGKSLVVILGPVSKLEVDEPISEGNKPLCILDDILLAFTVHLVQLPWQVLPNLML